MKTLIVALSIVFCSVSQAACDAPLGGHTFCANLAGGDYKEASFGLDCSFKYFGRTSSGYINTFDGTWDFAGDLLSISSSHGSGTRRLTFSEDGKSFSGEGYPGEVYVLCR